MGIGDPTYEIFVAVYPLEITDEYVNTKKKKKSEIPFFSLVTANFPTYRRHERVQDADGERSTARERLGQVQLGVRIVVIVLVQKLYVAVVDQFGDHRHVGSVHGPASLQHYGTAGTVQPVRIELFSHRGFV